MTGVDTRLWWSYPGTQAKQIGLSCQDAQDFLERRLISEETFKRNLQVGL